MRETIEIDISELLPAPTVGQSALAAAPRVAPSELIVTGVRELSQEDLEIVASAQVGVSTTPAIKAIRETHHIIAQMLAKGLKDIEVSRVTGYSPSRISVLKKDPAMVELISFYVEQVQEAFRDTVGKMKLITDDALDILGERLDNDPDSFTNNTLLEIVKTTGDRAGFAPVQKSVSISATVDPARLAAIKAKVRERENGEVRTIQVGLSEDSGVEGSPPNGSPFAILEES